MALKICNNDHDNHVSASHELQISRRIANMRSSHPGRQFVRTTIDSFMATGPHGTHMRLVYEPMREPIWLLQRRFDDGRYSSGILKWSLRCLLSGWDYLHSQCHIIHTGESVGTILAVAPNLSESTRYKTREHPCWT